MIQAKIVADSIGPAGIQLTTFEFVVNRYILAELNTHRSHSRNAASSRAIPVKKMISRIWNDPAMPVHWGANQAGMQAAAELTGWRRWLAIQLWKLSSKVDVIFAWLLMKVGVHKQIANRVLEPSMHITVIMTADQFGWANLFNQRNHKDAQPEFAFLARQAWILYNTQKPKVLKAGEWHLPYITDQDREDIAFSTVFELGHFDVKVTWEKLKAVSVGRCARVSYLSHDGKREPSEDIKLHDKLKTSTPGHWSPFEHVCEALTLPAASGNVRGWKQYRKEFAQEFLNALPEWKPEEYGF